MALTPQQLADFLITDGRWEIVGGGGPISALSLDQVELAANADKEALFRAFQARIPGVQMTESRDIILAPDGQRFLAKQRIKAERAEMAPAPRQNR